MSTGTSWEPTISNCDNYLGARTGKYDFRRFRYSAAIEKMKATRGLENSDTVVDVGAGWTEFDFCLRVEHGWRGRYHPIDGGLDGTDINRWQPKRDVEWFVALEILEHLDYPGITIAHMKQHATKGIVISTPNPRTTDVLGMDETHVTPITADMLHGWGFETQERDFYGNACDSILAWWIA